jgi:hypothetical protein
MTNNDSLKIMQLRSSMAEARALYQKQAQSLYQRNPQTARHLVLVLGKLSNAWESSNKDA